MPDRVITFRADAALEARMQSLKDRLGVPFTEQVRRALDRYLLEMEVGTKKTDRKRASTRKRP